jgi:hypothetical protein
MAELVNRKDVWMIECSGRFRFTLETCDLVRIRCGLREHLQGDLAVEANVFRKEDVAHPAFANLPEDTVLAEHLAEHHVTR